MGAEADGFVGIADQQMEMNRGAMWFNITAPRYSVEIVRTVTMAQGGMTSLSSGGVTVTNPVTWTTGAVPMPGVKDNGAGGVGVPTSMAVAASTGIGAGEGLSSRVPNFASVQSSAGLNWRRQWTAAILMAIVALIGVIYL